MLSALWRGLLLAGLQCFMLGSVHGAPVGGHRDDVDVSRYPWSAIGKLLNESGSACSGTLIASDKILTAAHCLYNWRTQRFMPPSALHFLIGYRSGRYAAHVRVASYEIGPAFDPKRYQQTSSSDWAILTTAESVPSGIEPLRLSRDVSPSGTRAVIAGYPQDRAHAMTADRDCELRDGVGEGRMFLHTCRGINGYSGAPILVSAGGDEVRIAGVQVATIRGDGADRMLAVPARVVSHFEESWATGSVARQTASRTEPLTEAVDPAPARFCEPSSVQAEDGRLALDRMHAVLGMDATFPPVPLPDPVLAGSLAWLATDPLGIAIP